MSQNFECDVIVVGSGAAGLSAAITAKNLAGQTTAYSASTTDKVAADLVNESAITVSATDSGLMPTTITGTPGVWQQAGATVTARYYWLSCANRIATTMSYEPDGCVEIDGVDAAIAVVGIMLRLQAAAIDAAGHPALLLVDDDPDLGLALRERADQLLQAGWTVVVDAAFLRRQERQAFAELARARGCPFHILAPQAPLQVLRQRIAQRQSAGHDPSEATLEVLERQLQWIEPLGADEPRLALE